MDRNEIIEQLTPIFRKVFSAPELVLTDELSANDVDNWGSLTHMTMMAEVENAFGISFKLKELKKLNKVGELIACIQSKA
ncbi:acyl carrier protein [Prevotella sp. RM4]|uniref:acyl carrier protein n=1 Tax=Prevotella sp. RM4 TaxID=1200547 RepID=UPI00051B4582|nr:acyl carrier protein [Prevotella sp. RM4]